MRPNYDCPECGGRLVERAGIAYGREFRCTRCGERVEERAGDDHDDASARLAYPEGAV